MRKPLSLSFVLAVSMMFGAEAMVPDALAADLCATPDQAIEVKALYSRNAGLIPGLASRQIDVPEVVIASAMPAVNIAGTSGEAFSDVWASVTKWDMAMTLIQKGGHVFEIVGSVPMGKRSERSNYFNLETWAPFGGHIRDDQLSAIYAMELPGRGGSTSRSVHFFDEAGFAAFSVVMTAESGAPTEEDIKNFEATMALIQSRGSVCPGS